MIDFLKNFLSSKDVNRNSDSDFSDFFTKANSEEKARVIKRVLREANEEQRELVEKYSEEPKSQLKPSLN